MITRVFGVIIIVVGVLSAAVVWAFSASMPQRVASTLLACALVFIGGEMSSSKRPLSPWLRIVAGLCAVAAMVLGVLEVVYRH
jgi:hypothetical protein